MRRQYEQLLSVTDRHHILIAGARYTRLAVVVAAGIYAVMLPEILSSNWKMKFATPSAPHAPPLPTHRFVS